MVDSFLFLPIASITSPASARILMYLPHKVYTSPSVWDVACSLLAASIWLSAQPPRPGVYVALRMGLCWHRPVHGWCTPLYGSLFALRMGRVLGLCMAAGPSASVWCKPPEDGVMLLPAASAWLIARSPPHGVYVALCMGLAGHRNLVVVIGLRMADSPSTSAWCIVCLLYGKLALLPLLGRHLPPLYGGEPLMHGRYPSPLYGVWMVHAIT